jgi:hypothetical protein
MCAEEKLTIFLRIGGLEQGVLDMSLAENVETLPQPRSGNYQVARFNALRHGVLSQYTASAEREALS